MSLEQVKEIIRKPWVAAHEDGKSVGTKPNPSSAKSSQNLCFPARIPVRITVRKPSGQAETYVALAILLNQRGARFESSALSGIRLQHNPFQLHQTLWIEVLTTGKSAGGKVVWADGHPNEEGNFEFAVELRDSGSLFNVFSLRQDLDQPETPKQSGKLALVEDRRLNEDLKAEAKPASDLSGAAYPSSNARPASQSSADNIEEAPVTDRLAELFKEVIQSAVRKEEDAASVRLVKEVKDEVGQVQQAALENLRKDISQQVSALEDQLLQQCRARTEHVLSTITRTALEALSTEMEEMAGRTEERIQGIFSGLLRQLEERSAKVLAEANGRMQAQVENTALGIHSVIVEKALSDIHEKQKDMLATVQQQIGMTTDQNLVKLRAGLIRALQELTEPNQSAKPAI